MSHESDVAKLVLPGTFEPARHTYPRVLNARIHPVVRTFLSMGPERMVQRYVHLNPQVDGEKLKALLTTHARWFRWSGSDLMHVTDDEGRRRMVVIETNSCPSGQKSMPLYDDDQEQGGYRVVIDQALRSYVKARRPPEGDLAVIYDKNPMETTGYAAALADLTHRRVWLAPFHQDDDDPPVRFEDGVMHVRDDKGQWNPVRAAFRYVTQRPWNRIPLRTRTAIVNPVVACLAGGRNKAVAAKAYELYNGELEPVGVQIATPETVWDVAQRQVPMWVHRMGGHAVIKVPYSNAGQGVFTITRPEELDAFMAMEMPYDQLVVQGLIGNHSWSSRGRHGRLYHVGTVPDRRLRTFVCDLRVMVCNGPDGFRPVAIYARRAESPLSETLDGAPDSWSMLGTNLSIKRPDGSWDTDTNRLMLMDHKDFNALGISVDGLIEAYVQTVLSTLAIDSMADSLMGPKGFRARLYRTLDPDPKMYEEILQGSKPVPGA